MNCKKCEAQLEEGMNFCPNCGTAQNETEAPAEELAVQEEAAVTGQVPAAKPGLGAGRIALLVILGLAAIGVVIALLLGGNGSGGESVNPAEKLANEVLQEWLNGEKTEESFAKLAMIYSEDPGSADLGGLYEGVLVGDMVEPFEDWCFDASRQPGDYGIVETSFGYHIMYFVNSDQIWYRVAEQKLMEEKEQAFLEQMLEKYPAEIDYSAIALGNVNMAQEDAADSAETPDATVPADGNPEDVTCKGSYTVSDEEIIAAADTVVATMGDAVLTNGELQIYYWTQVYDFLQYCASYGIYTTQIGLDYTQPLDTQLSTDGTKTWQQYFLDSALDVWCSYQATCLGAIEAGCEMSQEYQDYLDGLPQSLEEDAAANGFENAEALIRADMGVGAEIGDFLHYLEVYYRGYTYYCEVLENIEFTEEQVEAYYDEHAAELEEAGVPKDDEYMVDVRHILITNESGTAE